MIRFLSTPQPSGVLSCCSFHALGRGLAWSILIPALWGSVACGGDEGAPSESPDGVAEIRELTIGPLPPEQAEEPLFSAQVPALKDLLERLDAATRDEDAKGVLLRLAPFGGGFGRVAELRDAVLALRAAEKPVHCHFERLDNLGYWFASQACDRLAMTPAGDLNLVGLAAQLFFLKPMLDRIGVKADLMQVGRYKGAADPYTEEDLPETTAESLNLLLDDLQEELLTAIANARGMAPEALSAAIDRGPFSSGSALKGKLIDEIAFVDAVRANLRSATEAERTRRVAQRVRENGGGLMDLLSVLAGEPPEELPPGERLVVASLSGTIIDGKTMAAGSTASEPFVRAMKRFRDDPDVTAVVLRIDSPGGSALASDRMWHAVKLLAAKKVVIVSVGDIAASGGYYVASAADRILAPPGAILGSIGVVGGKIVFGELADQVGINLRTLRRGKNAAWTSATEPFSDSERAVLMGTMRSTYGRFLRRIEAGRGLSRNELRPLAEGRIWSGRRAVKSRLIDEIGTLEEAIQQARDAADLAADSPIERWPRERSPLDVLAEALGEDPDERAERLIGVLTAHFVPFPRNWLAAPLMLADEPTLAMLPFVFSLQ